MSFTAFLNAPANSVTRERIFFNRLCFDLKIAAARRDYPITLYEPEVDRDGYDIIIDDADNMRHFQLKTILEASKTKNWPITKRIMRPNILAGEKFSLAPADCGLGGGVILICIDSSAPEPTVTYYYTDYQVITAFHMRLFKESLKDNRFTCAQKFFQDIRNGAQKEKIFIDKKLFLRLKSPDALLAIAGFHSVLDCYWPTNEIANLDKDNFSADEKGASPNKPEIIRRAKDTALELYSLINEPKLEPFTG